MKRFALSLLFLLIGAGAPAAFAEGPNHGEVGAFVDYLRVRQDLSGNFWGFGGRVSVNVHNNIQLEGEMGYSFNRSFNEGFSDVITGNTGFQTSDIRILHGLFGPKIQTGGGPVRAFVTVKGGFMDFMFDSRPATLGTFFSSVDNLRANNVSGALYPGGGVEVYLGPVGLRFDIGDEIYFSDGAHHNLRMVIGPHIRF